MSVGVGKLLIFMLRTRKCIYYTGCPKKILVLAVGYHKILPVIYLQ